MLEGANMDENDKPDGSTAMERLARELMDAVVSCAPTVWCGEHGIGIHGTRLEQDRENARADISRRIDGARDEDDGSDGYAAVALKALTGMHRGHAMCTRGEVDEMVAAVEGWKAKAAELDALCVRLGVDDGDEALMVAGDLMDEHYELKDLRKAGRIMPEGVSWPRYEDGEPVLIGDVLRGRGRGQGEYKAIGVSACGRMTVVGEDLEDDENLVLLDPDLMDRAPKAVGADGREVKVGETVWLAPEYRDKAGDYSAREDGGRLMPECDLRGVYPDSAAKVASVVEHCVRLETSWDAWCPASWLTHERPDSWERLREDAANHWIDYWGCGGRTCMDCPAVVDGATPAGRYHTNSCEHAKYMDLLARAERLAGVRDDAK